MERLKPTEQKIGLSPFELKTASETVERLIPEFKSAISEISDPKILKTTGWGVSPWRKQAEESKWQWTTLYVGILASGQEKALRGPNGEIIDLHCRYDPNSEDKNPDFLTLNFTDSDGKRLYLDLNMKDYSIPTLDLLSNTKDSNYFVDLNYKEREVTVSPRKTAGIALFFKGFDFSKNGLLDLSKIDDLRVGASPAIPDHCKTSLKRPIDAVRWYLDQNYIGEKVSDAAKWIEDLTLNIDLVKELGLIEVQVKQTLQTILKVAKNPKLGKIWTQEDDNLAFHRRFFQNSIPDKRKTPV